MDDLARGRVGDERGKALKVSEGTEHRSRGDMITGPRGKKKTGVFAERQQQAGYPRSSVKLLGGEGGKRTKNRWIERAATRDGERARPILVLGRT